MSHEDYIQYMHTLFAYKKSHTTLDVITLWYNANPISHCQIQLEKGQMMAQTNHSMAFAIHCEINSMYHNVSRHEEIVMK